MTPLQAAIFVQLVSLQAEQKALRNFILNQDANFRANIIDKQIEALRNIKETE